MKLDQQVAIVTGSSRGIGKATGLSLLREGAKLVILSRHRDELLETAGEFRKKFGEKILAIPADVTKVNDVEWVVSQTEQKFGRIDVLVNNAGVAVYKPVADMSEEEWDLTLDVNLKGLFLFSKAVLPLMIKQNYGRIINISSGLGRSGYPGLAAYSASKFGVIGFTESLAHELGNTGIKVFAVLPGGVDTKMHRDVFPQDDPRFLIRPERVAQVIVSLADPHSRKPSGSSIEVY